MLGTILAGKQYSRILVPGLAIFAIPHIPENWMSKSTNPAVQEAITAIGHLRDKQAKVFEAGVPTARVISLRGTHYIFLSDEAAVLRDMRTFLAGLR